MAVKLGINGFGRIGSIALRIALQQPEVFDVVAIAKREADIDYMI
ncbi:MAG: type I glyceraldehyde-3-phosphate dehydrogenase, partial [Clostridia bacterium]|nr:type I glyceraldehyde-3-phosphate dehydrogenase [Clostridia bacterium]